MNIEFSDLLALFNGKGVVCGEDFIVSKKYCYDFVQAVKSLGFVVIGAEGFYILEDGSVKPNLNEIANFSDIDNICDIDEYIEAWFEAIKRFLMSMNISGNSDGYCFVLTDPEELGMQ